MKNIESKTSVIIPTYNDSHEDLKKAILSVKNQSLPPKEIIIIDDGSANTTAEDVVNLINEPNNTNIKLFKKKNGGPSSARNLGLANCTGEFVAFLDSDDEMLPNNLFEKETALQNLHEDYFGVYGTYTKIPKNLIHKHNDFDGLPNTDNVEKTNGIPGSAPSYLFRKYALDKIGGFDINLTNNEDFDLIIRLIKMNMQCKGNIGQGFIRNYRPGSLTRSKKYFDNYKNVLKFLEKATQNNYFTEKELKNRYKLNELQLGKDLIFNEKRKEIGFMHLNKAFKYSHPTNTKQIIAFILTKFYNIYPNKKF